MYSKALDLLSDCSTSKGFIASPNNFDNYRRVFSRDGVVTSLAALMTGKYESVVKSTLKTLLDNQLETGQIPSNVGLNGEVSYGGTAGRVDANTWLIIGFSQYIKRSGDKEFLEEYFAKVDKIIHLLRCYEFNDKGLLYVPLSGNWADQYIHHGYVLYDQILYYIALKEYAYLLALLHRPNSRIVKKAEHLKGLIRKNYFKKGDDSYIYHKPLYLSSSDKPYLLPYFHPGKVGSKFDGFGNSLALHTDILSEDEKESIINYVENEFGYKTRYLLPAFSPVIDNGSDFEMLRTNYLSDFRNKPFEYHNGGLWPVVTGFYASGIKNPVYYLESLSKLKEFPEFLNGSSFESKGVMNLCWSAAALIIVKNYSEGERLFI